MDTSPTANSSIGSSIGSSMNSSISSSIASSRISHHICANRILDVVPAVMRCIHAEVRQQKSTCLTIPQLRSLDFLKTNAGVSLAELADYLGISSASTSTMIERLVQKELVTRTVDPNLKRQVILNLTAAGEEHLHQVLQETGDRLADKLEQITLEQILQLINGLGELHQIFMDCGLDPRLVNPTGRLSSR
ncbi:MarR family transcriptional regulator [Pseudanabaena sp. UWO310]|nr:MarR family transcriptional regulator [Pseudanabaena sp. UWO310]